MSVVPIWRALFALAIGAAIGGAILARADLRWRAAEITVRALLGMALVAAFTVHVALGLTLSVAIAWLAAREREGAREAVVHPLPKLALGAISVVTAAAALRPPVPLFWDESVWLTKARVACAGPFELMARATDPASDLVPRGYPIVAAVLEASFALGDASLSSLVAGGSALVIASFALFALLLDRGTPAREVGATLVVLAAVPLVWVHLQSVQLDLPVGLLAAALFLAIERAGKGDPLGLPAALTAALLLGIKDEGMAYAVALAAAVLASDRTPSARRAAVLSCAALALATGVYRFALWRAGSTNDDHSVAAVAIGAVPALAREALRHAVDVETWGIFPGLVVASCALGLRRSSPPRTKTLLRALGLAFSAVGLALLMGPSRVRDFALEGTLLNRLGLEVLPLSAILCARVMLGEPAPALGEPAPALSETVP